MNFKYYLYKMKKSKWKDIILKLINEGKSHREIEKLLGCSKATISYHSNTEVKNKIKLRIINNKRNLKIKCVEYKGGKCEICGYNKYFGALEFHHKNPLHKIKTIGHMVRKWEFMKKELDKCILLCANCHKELHGKLTKN